VATGSDTWLVAPPLADVPPVVGLTFDAGLARQPAGQLGVAALAAAWLVRVVGRPAEAVDRPDGLRATPYLTPAECTVVLAGPLPAVRAGLVRLRSALADPAPEIDDELRSRARMLDGGLEPWAAHLAARWRGHPVALASLGPVALDVLDGPALAGFLAARYGPADRVLWTTEPALVPPGAPARRTGAPGRPELPAARARPGCVVRRSAGEAFSALTHPFAAADRIALGLLADAVHRRLVELQPLASEVDLRLRPLPGRRGLVTCELVGALGDDAAVSTALAETIEDLAAGVAPEEVDRVGAGLAERTAIGPVDPGVLDTLARRQLATGDLQTPAGWAGELAVATDAEVRAALRSLRDSLLLAVPEAGTLPYELAGPARPPPAEGRRYPAYGDPATQVRCSSRRVARVRLRPSWRGRFDPGVTLAAVDFADVVLRVDSGDEVTTLVDADLGSIRLAWAAVRGGRRLREAVAARTTTAPRIRRPPGPELGRWLAELHGRRRRARLRTAAVAVSAALLVGVGTAVAVASRQRPVVAEVEAAETVRLANGTTLRVVGSPRPAATPNGYAVRVEMCGGGASRGTGGGDARNVLGPAKFALLEDGRPVGAPVPAPAGGGPPVPDVVLAPGECAGGWLTFAVPSRVLVAPRLRYANLPGDRVSWRLPAATLR
jgi:hypothetical protein